MKRLLLALGCGAAATAAVLAAGCEAPSPAPPKPDADQAVARADALFLQEHYGQAASHFEAVAADAPERPELRVKAGKAWLGAGQPERAVQQFERALASSPPAPVRLEALFRRAVAQRLTGNAARALDSLRQLDAADPEDLDRAGLTMDEIAWERAQTQFRLGDWKSGQSDLAKISPKGPFGDRVRSRLGMSSWTVQIGAFADNGPARSLAGRVPGAQVREVPGQPALWIVTVGSWPRHEDARRELDRLKSIHPDAFLLP